MITWIKSWFPPKPVVYAYTFRARPRGSLGGLPPSGLPASFRLEDGAGSVTLTEAEFEKFKGDLVDAHYAVTDVARRQVT